MYKFNEEKGNSITFNINRKLSRPYSDMLRPFRLPVNDYTFVEGNPFLRPQYPLSASLTYTLKDRYNFTFNVTSVSDYIVQMAFADETDPNILIYRYTNMDKDTQYRFKFYLPFDPYKWWNIVANISGTYSKVRYLQAGKSIERSKPVASFDLDNNFDLGHRWNVNLSGWFASAQIEAETDIEAMYGVALGFGKVLIKDKLNLNFRANNILHNVPRYTVHGEGFTSYIDSRYDRRTFNLSLRYTFNKGKKVNVKKVQGDGEARF